MLGAVAGQPRQLAVGARGAVRPPERNDGGSGVIAAAAGLQHRSDCVVPASPADRRGGCDRPRRQSLQRRCGEWRLVVVAADGIHASERAGGVPKAHLMRRTASFEDLDATIDRFT